VLTRVGIAFTPFETRAGVIVRLAQRAERLGLARVDVAEGWSQNALIVLSDLAARTDRIGLGSAAITAWGRSPATLAAGATDVQLRSGGRFTLGLGTSSPTLPGGFHEELPVLRLHTTVAAVRTRLARERVPIALAACTPGAIRVAGELADAWMPFGWARSRLGDGRALLGDDSRRRLALSPRRRSIPTITPAVPLALGPNATRLAAAWLRMLPTEAEPADVALFGAYETAGDGLAEWFDAGADHVQLVLPPGLPEAELGEMLDAVAEGAR
jgi:alkanesulfonate monooxygenase SsuD/methylene tetrahydromethanopterin reductase-like flavin-dependent oxidoreductase (luciferase family)